MSKVEIDETEYLAAKTTLDTINRMMAHPEARTMVLKARKTVDPTVVIPELDAAEPVRSEVSELRKLIEDERKERQAEAAARAEQERTREFQNQWNGRKAALRDQGYTNEAVERIEALAQERGIADLEAAAALFDRMNPAPAVSQPGGGFDFFAPGQSEADDTEFFKNLWESQGKNDAVVNKEINRILTDARGGARR